MEQNARPTVAVKWRTAECVVNVGAVLEGEFNDWPSNIQDGIYAALERLKHRTRKDFQIFKSYSDNDIDSGPYVHVIAGYLETVM